MGTAKLDQPSRMWDRAYWKKGRLVAHIAGEAAGNLRLDIEISEISNAEAAAELVTLAIPGELSPLVPTGAIGEDGRYVISYFSSDVANAGKLPSEAVVCWSTEQDSNRMRSVDVVSATKVSLEQGSEAAQLPERLTNRSYPTAVAMIALLGAMVASALIAAKLIWPS